MELKRISFVVTSRNDGETDDELVRIQEFVTSLLEQCDRFDLDAELIIVEWNPPVQKPFLIDVLPLPKRKRACSVRIIRVPPDVHLQFKNSEKIQLFQMIAKNVGIRRAHGRYVLVTNVDIVLSNEIMQFLSSRHISPNRMYRIDRHDVPAVSRPDLSLDERLEWYDRNILRVYRYLETVDVVNGFIAPLQQPKTSMWLRLSNWLARREKPLHTNACGDFTLLTADYWMKVAGYPEFPTRAMKLDGLLCYAAHYAGAKEFVLKDPMRIYHLDHSARVDGASIALSERNYEGSDIQISQSQYHLWVEQMRRTHRPIIFNTPSWGLADMEFPEFVAG